MKGAPQHSGCIHVELPVDSSSSTEQDAEGARVAKGTITYFTCDFNPADTYNPSTNTGFNGFQTTNDYILGPGGEQMTEMGINATATPNCPANTPCWQHTNVYANGALTATYDAVGLHFYFNDPLGTRRAQTDYEGVLEQLCSGLPFGDALNCTTPPNGNGTNYPASLAAPTEHHFTGKERDTESGNDYFEARYYSSAIGRFMSPDWSAKAEPVPYAKLDNPQSLNLYAYVLNNPLGSADPDGHCCEDDFKSFQTPEQRAWMRGDVPADDLDRVFFGRLGQFIVGGLGVAATAAAAPVISTYAAAAETIGQGLSVGAAALGATGMGVNAVANLAGAATNTNTSESTDRVSTLTDPVSAVVGLTANSAEKGSQAGDAVTVAKAMVDVASGRGVKNPAEALGSVGGAISIVKSVAKAVGSYITTPAPPPVPKAPGRPSCSVTGAC
jgi:RHS repeat-associated protein